MSTSTLPPDMSRYQPQCGMPPWTSSVLPPEEIPDILRQIGEHLAGYEQFVADTDSEGTFDLLDEVLSDRAPSAQRIPYLTARLSALLARLLDAERFIRARHPDQDTLPGLGAGRRVLEDSAETETLGSVRRLALAALAVLELAGEPL
ncbi:hypothetical protein [Streptomyces sp. NPDC001404]|uniref:hypothetical protein n=1 Tax=Streptomyces sp. NPDC001404 TaxID=3364571 RepID=UPI0036A6655B